MQCQGKTRSGVRCRNRSLDGELFCDIHMRVNHSYNLALLIPLLLGLSVGYFFFFGLLFNTVIFGVFDINYLAYAGVEDLFLNMLRFGGMITLILALIWTLYAVCLFVAFSALLIYRMIKATDKPGLAMQERLKIITLSLAIFTFNVLLQLATLIPARHRRHADRVTLKRENFARSLFDLKGKKGTLRPGKPILTARGNFQHFLYFKSAGNHRFLLTTLLLFMVSLGVTYHAGGKAEYARACSLAHSGTVDAARDPFLPFPAFILEGSCQIDKDEINNEGAGLTSKFISSLTGFFDFKPVTVQAADGSVSLLHLATTSRFDLFFNGRTGLSLALPRGSLSPLQTSSMEDDSIDTVSQITERFSHLESQLQTSGKTLSSIGASLLETNKRIEKLKLPAKIPVQNQPAHRNEIHASQIPQACWNRQPDHIVAFELGSYILTDAEALDALVRLSLKHQADPEKSLVVAGYADPSGSKTLNRRLSTKRAGHIRKLFKKLGIPSRRILSIGMGISQSKNHPRRRVEIRACELG